MIEVSNIEVDALSGNYFIYIKQNKYSERSRNRTVLKTSSHFYFFYFIHRAIIEKTAERFTMKIENDAEPFMWFADCLGPEPQDWMKDVGLDWFDEELLGRPESPVSSAPVPAARPAAAVNNDDHRTYRGGYPSYTIESSAWLIQQHQRSADSGDDNDEDDSLPPPVLPPMIPGTRSFSDQLHRIRKPYALGSPPSTSASGLLVRRFQYIELKHNYNFACTST